MLFNSLPYLIFLPVVVIVYYALSQRQRQIFLLLSSLVFYSFWSLHHANTWPKRLKDLLLTDGLLLATTVVDYSVARWLMREPRPGRRRWILAVSLASNLSMLAVFKYANFLRASLASWFGAAPWPELDVVLPPGISFYTFMSMAYVIDVYRREVVARDKLLDFAVFVAYFPHLVAGPILRAKQLLPQLTTHQPLDWANIRRGVGLILWGMLLKVYLADPLARVVNEVYSDPARASGAGLLVATYAFAGQIYCDFSGYTDIAIGSALLLGIKLPENFQTPYLAVSITDFWRRWHISLSTWLRDYLYIPLGGNRVGRVKTYANLMITMLLGGLWHGAGWHWLIWGGIHGLALSLERLFRGRTPASPGKGWWALRWVITFHIVCLSWVFFRSRGLQETWVALGRILRWAPGVYFNGFFPLIILALILLMDLAGVRNRWVEGFSRSTPKVRWVVYASAVVLALTFQRVSNPEFIYFQF
jgi:D-alanyl-lipoteichoic acid acyltransferase DltB (MBOAT superfamily)